MIVGTAADSGATTLGRTVLLAPSLRPIIQVNRELEFSAW